MPSGRWTYSDIVVQFNTTRTVELDFSQRLTDDIVGLSLRVLDAANGGCFVEVALVVDVELPEGILQAEDFVLLELREFS